VHTYRYTLTFSSHQRNDVMRFYQLTFLQVPARNPPILIFM